MPLLAEMLHACALLADLVPGGGATVALIPANMSRRPPRHSPGIHAPGHVTYYSVATLGMVHIISYVSLVFQAFNLESLRHKHKRYYTILYYTILKP